MSTQTPKTDYVVNIAGEDKYQSPAKSQEQGNYTLTLRRYSDVETELDNNNSSVVGIPNVLGGANVSALYPKAWTGAEAIYNLDSIVTTTISPKVGSGDLTSRGTASIFNLTTVDVFQDDPYAFAATSVNYLYNKGNVNGGGGTTAVNPVVGNSLYIDAVGADAIGDSVVASIALDKDWERSIRFTPTTIAPASEVFILSKGFGSSANCQYAISYDSTSIYRTIGGSKVAVGATATYLATNKETTLSIVNMGEQTTAKDSFFIDGVVVRDNLSTDRGVVTSVRKEMIGGIFETDSDASASISNATGYYRQFAKYNEERVASYVEVADQQMASFVNYMNAIMVFGIGDSIMNGIGENSLDRSVCWLFKIESWLKGLGFDVLFANAGVNGTQYESLYPSHLAKPASLSETVVNNPNFSNITRYCKEYRADLIIANSGTNEYANQNSPNLPYDWYNQLAFMAMISSECARYGVKLIHNTTGAHTLPNTDYERDVGIGVNSQLLQRCQNVINWRDVSVDTATGLAISQLFNDDVHPKQRLADIIARMHRPYLRQFFETVKLAYPEVA